MSFRAAAVALAACALAGAAYGLPTRGTVTEVTSFSVSKSPSGLFHYAAQDLLYILCGTQTNGDHYLYAYTTGGDERCLITIPASAGMSRVDGFWIDEASEVAYIVDSQGPIYASESGKLGGSVYEVDWTNPCGCASDSTCAESDVSWSPTVTRTWTLSATEASIGDGGGNDEYFRNSGIAIVGDSFFAVNGVHPNSDLECCYPKSVVEVDMASAAVKAGGNAAATRKWQFDAATIGHDVDMEALACGPDECATSIFIGDEYNYIYNLTLSDDDPATAIGFEWNLRSIVGDVNDDKGIESLTYASSTGYFYAGIQETSVIHVVELSTAECVGETCGAAASSVAAAAVLAAALAVAAQLWQ